MNDFISIPVFIILVGGGIIIGLLLASIIYETEIEKLKNQIGEKKNG